MIKKITAAFFSLLLLTACSHGKSSSANSKLMAEFASNVGDRVFFAYDKSHLSKEAMDQLMKQAEWLKSHGNVQAVIAGHADERGTREYNLALGERRAMAVKKFLVEQGISQSRIDTISYGKERPEVVGTGEEAWSKNRRAVTEVMTADQVQ